MRKVKRKILLAVLSFPIITIFLWKGWGTLMIDQNVNSPRLLLCKLRDGDYSHAGDVEAIEIVLQKVLSIDPTIKNEAVLDVGSGLGGTANYLYQQAFRNVHGIDSDQAAVTYARDKYPTIDFKVGDALNVDNIYSPHHFSFLYLFNVIYAIHDKALLLKKLDNISKPGSILVICDYAQGKNVLSEGLKDLAGNRMYPIQIESLKKDLRHAGWKVIETTNMTPHYIVWYRSLLEKLTTQNPLLKKDFSVQDLSKVEKTFTFLLNQLEQGNLEGITIYARKEADKSSTFGFEKPEDSPGLLLWQATVTWQRLIKKVLDPYSLTHSQFVIMAILLWFEEHQEKPTQIAISRLSKLEKMTVSKSLKQLAAQGYISRQESQKDTRAKWVTLTPQGKELITKLVPRIEKTDADFFGGLNTADQKLLVHILNQLTK